ncbi:MAG: hypothetical protein MI784_07665 [Cytophagales bacterium]|nr:hypothetical protein [Cytophagales bacterium]
MKGFRHQLHWQLLAWGLLVLAVYLLVSALYAHAYTLGFSEFFEGQIAGVALWGGACLLGSMYCFRRIS